MWLATKFGYYSIVNSEIDGKIVIRGRKISDIRNLINSVRSLRNCKLVVTRKNDYICRIFVDLQQLADVMSLLILNLDYSNFKDMIYKNKDQKDKAPYYTRIWNVMYEYQNDKDTKYNPKNYKRGILYH
jgi:hypothetical protein